MSFASRSESHSSVLTLPVSRAALWTSRTPRRASYPGVHGSSTLSEADSDLRSAYLTVLCCAFRLSQPLDALFHPLPFQPCFMLVTPLNFHLQRFSLSAPGRHLSMPPSPPAVSINENSMTCGFRGSCVSRESVLTASVLPAHRKSILSWRFTLRGLFLLGLGLAYAWPPLMGFGTSSLHRGVTSRTCSAEFQRTEE